MVRTWGPYHLMTVLIVLLALNSSGIRGTANSFQVYLPVMSRQRLLPPNVSILADTSGGTFEDPNGNLHVLGEMGNNSGTAVEFVKVTAKLELMAVGETARSNTAPQPDLLAAPDYTCFDVVFPPPHSFTTVVFLEPEYHATSKPLSTGLRLHSPSSSSDVSGHYHLSGYVSNDGAATANSVQIVGTLYDQAGRVADCGFTYAKSTILAPGQTSLFELVFMDRPSYSLVANWRLAVSGRP